MFVFRLVVFVVVGFICGCFRLFLLWYFGCLFVLYYGFVVVFVVLFIIRCGLVGCCFDCLLFRLFGCLDSCVVLFGIACLTLDYFWIYCWVNSVDLHLLMVGLHVLIRFVNFLLGFVVFGFFWLGGFFSLWFICWMLLGVLGCWYLYCYLWCWCLCLFSCCWMLLCCRFCFVVVMFWFVVYSSKRFDWLWLWLLCCFVDWLRCLLVFVAL